MLQRDLVAGHDLAPRELHPFGSGFGHHGRPAAVNTRADRPSHRISGRDHRSSVRSPHGKPILRCRPNGTGRALRGGRRAHPRVLRRSLVRVLPARTRLRRAGVSLAFMGASIATPRRSAKSGSAHAGKIACARGMAPSRRLSARRPRPDDQLTGLPTFCALGRRIAGASAAQRARQGASRNRRTALLPRDARHRPAVPTHRRREAALQPVLDRCDPEGLTAYLETQKEENLAYYRARFELQRKLDIEGVPPLWTMSRKP